MNVLIVGAGPAGLCLAYLLKRSQPAIRVRLVEQNAADSTFGFGVVFSDRALDFLRADDPETHAALVPALQTWHDLAIVHRGERIVIDGVWFAAIGRLELLQLLQQRLARAGVTAEYGHPLTDRSELDGYDLVVAADGANSFVRRGQEAEFGTCVEPLRNHFVWYGTTQRFETLTQTFVSTPLGPFNAHHYRYSPTMSTFIVECDPVTWQRVGFAKLDDAATRAVCETVFADTLAGHSLIPNKSVWRHFPRLRNERWSVGRHVLLGDALRTAHFSIGSGTRLSFEDAIALAHALERHPGRQGVPLALAAYEAARRPVVDKLAAAAATSAQWYEDYPRHMTLPPWELAWSYVQRSGRVDPDRLRRVSPRFVAGYEAWMAGRHGDAN